jgi:DNA-binding NarL/FixJ family response regulator
MVRAELLRVLTVEGRPARADLEGDGDIRVIASVHRDHILRALRRERRGLDAVVLTPVDDNLDVVREIRIDHPDCEVVLTDMPEEAASLLEAFEAGARGYVPTGVPAEHLRRVVRVVAAGAPAFPRGLLGPVLELTMARVEQHNRALRQLCHLTSRERSVLGLLIEGRSNDAIAEMLQISPQTVRKHVQRILTKLGVHSRLAAVSFVHRHSLSGAVADEAGASAAAP